MARGAPAGKEIRQGFSYDLVPLTTPDHATIHPKIAMIRDRPQMAQIMLSRPNGDRSQPTSAEIPVMLIAVPGDKLLWALSL